MFSAQDVSPVESINKRMSEFAPLLLRRQLATHDYTIGNGDLLNISVFDVPELSREVRVSQSGSIGIPLVPTRVHMAGLSEIQAQQVIADVLQAEWLVSHPEVSVIVKEHKNRPITIVGAVGHPMVYEADQNVTLLEVLAQAGGITNDAGDTIIVTRAARPASSWSQYLRLLATRLPALPPPSPFRRKRLATRRHDAKSNPNPLPFPSAPEMGKTHPPANTTNSQSRPSSPGTTYFREHYYHQSKRTPGNGSHRNNIPLQPGDVVTVPHAGIVYVLGAVNRPGGFVLFNDRTEITTMKVLPLAGGLTKIAKLDHAVIIRKDAQGKADRNRSGPQASLNQKAEDIQMRASDVLYIPDNHVKEALLQALQIAVGRCHGSGNLPTLHIS